MHPFAFIVTSPIKIDIWSDIACPWCYIGKRHLEAGITSLGDDAPEVEITYHSFELAPDTPVDFEGSEVDFLAKHKGLPAAARARDARPRHGRRRERGARLPLRHAAAHQDAEGARTAALRQGAGPAARALRAAVPRVLHRGPPRRPRRRARRARHRGRPRRRRRARGARVRPLRRGRAGRHRARRRPTASTACRSSSSTASTASRVRSPARCSRRRSPRSRARRPRERAHRDRRDGCPGSRPRSR